jgi:flagellar protein FliS
MNPAIASANAYLKNRVMTASPEELRMMLLEGAVKFARQGRDGLARKDFEASFSGITQSRNIVLELLTSIRSDVDRDLAEKVKALYTYIYTEMTNANLEKDLDRLDKVISLLDYERETWAMLMQKLAEERAAGGVEAKREAISISG